MNKLTPYQLRYLAWLITHRRSVSDDDRYTGVLAEAQVDLNPHQVDAALFAFHSPLSKGAILADEVGLGKTIEAGIVISQQWAENHRHILIVCPASLRRQWSAELEEKFFLPSTILEKKNFDETLEADYKNPFEDNRHITICSYQFASKKIKHVSRVQWDLVIFDEAHKLRNVYRQDNKIANKLRSGLKNTKKLLLTATPLQNDVKELYGLVSFIDEDYFGSLDSFTAQYGAVAMRKTGNYADLRERLKPIIHRTLRKDVQEYVCYTERHPMLQEYYPTDDEESLRLLVEEYLRRDGCFGIPNGQRSLITLVLQKLLSSSTFAIAGTLLTIVQRLEDLIKKVQENSSPDNDNSASDAQLAEKLLEDYELMDEFDDEEDEEFDDADSAKRKKVTVTAKDIPAIKAEIADLRSMYSLAMSIAGNTKGECLLQALKVAFANKKAKGEPEKALIFTESTRTQKYVEQLLEDNGYKGKLVLFNGSNNDPTSKAIYQSWKQRNEGTNKISGSLTADKRQALVDYFRDKAQIMIATEAAAEGINLQFCSLVVNYDMPWNPQRVEQRIGRCHRYGQKYDVVVVNFINKKNRADERIYELLDQKFQLFEGVFGSSDEVLGSIGDGVDFEKRVMKICQECRSPQEIDNAFDQLQKEMSSEITATVESTTNDLFRNFDEDVVRKLKVRRDNTKESLDEFQSALWRITVDQLGKDIDILDAGRHIFQLKQPPEKSIFAGKYSIGITAEGTYSYRPSTALAQWVVTHAEQAVCDDTDLYEIDYSHYGANISRMARMVGHHGIIVAKELDFSAERDREQRIVFTGMDLSTGEQLDDEIIKKVLEPGALSHRKIESLSDSDGSFTKLQEAHINAEKEAVQHKNNEFLLAEAERINRWADDQTDAAEQEISTTKKAIREKENEIRHETDAVKIIELQEVIRQLTKKKRKLRDNLNELEDNIDEQRHMLIERSKASLKENIVERPFFAFQWVIR